MSVATLVAVAGSGTAVADPVGGGTAEAFGASLNIVDQGVIPPTAEAKVTAPPFGDDQDETAIPINADPLIISNTLIARAAVHEASDLPSTLEQAPAQHTLAGPYNARAVGQVEDLEVLPGAVDTGVPLIEADLIRGEAVAVCRAGAVEYAASSEIVNLGLGGQDPLSGPVNEIIAQLEAALEPLADVVDVKLNVVTADASGASVDALVITLLAAAGEDPFLTVRLGHAKVSGVTCGGAAAGTPQCSDQADNDGDGKVDTLDPGCHSDNDPTNPNTYVPSDNDETDGTQCADTRDNDGDGVIDALDPGCHTDGNAANPASYDASDNDEANTVVAGASLAKSAAAAPLAATGGTVATGLAAALGLGALGLFALRRRVA